MKRNPPIAGFARNSDPRTGALHLKPRARGAITAHDFRVIAQRAARAMRSSCRRAGPCSTMRRVSRVRPMVAEKLTSSLIRFVRHPAMAAPIP